MKIDPPISFEAFMASALHDPRHGYYARRIAAVGRGGDFTTAPMLGNALARAIAAWADAALRETGCRDLIEIGPGEGVLAAGILANFPWFRRLRVRLHLVETSPPLAARQRTLLGKRARWHESMPAALAACNDQAVIFSNELVDAFPVRRYENAAGGWREIAVAIDAAGRTAESLLPSADLPDSSVFALPYPPGQRVEVHESYRRYLETWLPAWKSGRLLTIDYGGPAETIYHRRPLGTVRGYLLQQRIEGMAVYENVGRQDLTADVNFTDLQRWSQPWIEAGTLTNLADFLRPTADPRDPLLDEAGAGGAFLVLDQKHRPVQDG